MHDSIIKGTGNSRYLKSVAAFLTQYPTYADFAAALAAGTLPVELNGINEEGFQQLGTALNKENLLQDNTAAIYGLGTDAVPDDVFAWLGKYNQYWWKRRTYITESGYVEKQTEYTGGTSSISYINKRIAAKSTNYSQSECKQTVQYASGITISSNGTVSLSGPKSLTVKYGDNCNTLKGKYVTNMQFNTSGIYYIPANAASPTSTDVDDVWYIGWTSTIYTVTSEYVTTPTIGDWSYLQSSNRNAYPDSGIVDGYEYLYLGKPYENFLEGNAKIRKGSYTGTGTYGKSANEYSNSIYIDFNPSIVLISKPDTYNYAIFPVFSGLNNYGTVGSAWENGYNLFALENGKLYWWYGGTGTNTNNIVKSQLNMSGKTYNWVSIG